jgi:hypothetical protein
MRWRFVARRLVMLLVTLRAASFVIFAAVYLAPGSPLAALSGGPPLSPSSVTVRAGYRTRITVSFQAPADLYGTPVTPSASGLPSGVTASFSPRTATIGGRAVLTLTATPSTAAGAFAATVTARTVSSDPIGTSTPLGLTISAP